MAKQITCWRCPADLGLKVQKPKAPNGVLYTLSDRDIVKHLCADTGLDECWIWRWGRNSAGYAQVQHNGKQELVGPILLGILGTGLKQIHACDNPPCVKLSHLRAGTQAENAADRERKLRGNQPKGSGNANAKLTEKDIPVIRACLAAGESQRNIARRYDVSRSPIGRIKRGEIWKHVP